MNHLVSRRKALASLAAAGACTLLPPAALGQSASAYPTGPVRIVLPFPPGTVNDTITRIVAERLAARWKQPVTIDNRPGASSMIGTAAVAQSAPDGHTLLANITLMLQNPALRNKLPYDPASIVPVAQFNRQQLPVFVRSDLGIDSAEALFAYARSNPGKINFASWGLGSTAHIIHEKIQRDKGIRMTHVPYKGGADIVRALLSGEADVAVADFLSPAAHFKSGKFRVIAVTGPVRAAHLPSVPTLKEAGVEGFEGYNWLGLFAPAGTPPEVMAKIAEGIASVQSDPQLVARFRDEMYVEPTSAGPAEFRRIYEEDGATWRSVIKVTGVSLE